MTRDSWAFLLLVSLALMAIVALAADYYLAQKASAKLDTFDTGASAGGLLAGFLRK